MTIASNSVVSIHYTLTDDDGNTLDSSIGGEPLVYLHGAQNIIPGLENALVGKQVGDKLDVRVEPAEGYGDVQAHMIQEVPKEAFKGVDELEVGMRFTGATEDGGQIPVVITAVSDSTVTVDGNHPLAGKHLNFAVSIEEIRDANPEELQHGHAHGPGGHHH